MAIDGRAARGSPVTAHPMSSPSRPRSSDDSQGEQDGVPLVRPDLAVERVDAIGIQAAARRADAQLRVRSTFGTASASGSASKNSRLMKPNGPAISTLGMVWMVLL